MIVRTLIIATIIYTSMTPANAETLRCTTSFQGYRVCDNGHDYRSAEWGRDGMRFGQDSDGRRWTMSR